MPAWTDTIPLFWFWVVMLGLAFGSFLNVVIYRLPLGQSLWRGRSRCPTCERRIAAYDNIPLLSFMLLRARCRHCRAPISGRYPLVELLGVLCLALAAWASPSLLSAIVRAVFLLAMVVVFFVDLDHRIIPDEISLGGIVVGIAAAPLVGVGRIDALIGAAVGVLSFLLIAVGYQKLRGISGMGGGDIKLAGTLGAFLGWKGFLLTVVLGSLAGSVLGILLLARRRATGQTALPFGCFLAPAGAIVVLLGEHIWAWYLALRVS